ncbi:TonB-dependent siderophore receptor [Sphingomonas sp.]|uniref:TonB-dependent receptor n=1 Tax=Sphingomonas sp. TaxID=28214 RepID=UPI00286B66DB|nr:TonB-dependent siderophore receptor [Sphingomonas sp.]
MDVASDDAIIIEGQRSSYGAAAITSATKTNTPVRNIPQAITIITKAQIDDQGLRSIGDLLTFVPGASAGTGESNRDQIVLRGNNTTADFFINGVRDDVQYFRDFYNVERVEILKGPNAMIFGRGGGGGIVNRVTKQSRIEAVRSFTIGTSSFGGVRATADVDQPLTGSIGLRVNGLYENGESFRRHVDLERYGINPTIGFAIAPETRLDLSYEYFHDRRTTDRGVPSVTDPAGIDKPLKGFDRTFFGDPDDSYARADVHLLGASISHKLADGLTLRNRTSYGDYNKFYQNIYPSNLDEATNQVVLDAYNSTNDRRNLISQTDLVWENRLGGIDQTLLAGVEVGRQWSRNKRLNGTIMGGNRVPLSDPTVDVSVTYATAASAADNRTRADVAAFYIQDQIRFAPWIELVLGLRYDRFKLEVDDFHGTGTSFKRADNLWSPRLGLILKPTDHLSFYASYSRSFLPQSGDQFGGLSATTEALKPERFENIEVGAKWEPVEGLLATAALYQLDRTNTRANDPLNNGQTVLTGAQRSRGLELGLERSITNRWQISAGYAWQEAEIRDATTAAPAGRKVPLVPKHSFALWSRYEVTKAFGLGVGLTARSKSNASISNQVVLPGYARVDAAAFFKVTRGVEAQLNVENLLGADYFPAAHSDNNIAPGGPRSAKLSLRLGF